MIRFRFFIIFYIFYIFCNHRDLHIFPLLTLKDSGELITFLVFISDLHKDPRRTVGTNYLEYVNVSAAGDNQIIQCNASNVHGL